MRYHPRMASKKDKTPPKFSYPAAPYIIGLNWIEVAVTDPAAAADRLVSIGFQDRTVANGQIRVAISGLLLHLVPRPTGSSKASGLAFEMAVDQVEMMHMRLEQLGLKPEALVNRDRGDRSFEWTDPDGHRFRFIGPARRADDPVLDDEEQ